MTTEPAGTLHATIHSLADAVADGALVAGGQAAWLAPWPVPGRPTEVVERPGGPTLYDGSAGIALACLAVGLSLERPDLCDLAIAGARHAVAQTDRLPTPGLYDGRAGVGLAALAIGRALGEGKLVRAGAALLDGVRRTLPECSDLVSGLTGVSLAHLRAAVLTGEERWLSSARETADVLVARAHRCGWGWSWPDGSAGPGLCGLAHGAAGPAWVLAELDAATEGNAFAEAVEGACQYEQGWFDRASGTWPDLRSSDAPPNGGVTAAWCHGAVGIGLGRLGTASNFPTARLTAQIAVALRAASSAAREELSRPGVPPDLTVCHGLGGTLELLMEAHLAWPNDGHLAAARWLATRAVHLLDGSVTTWPGGVRGRPSPALMTGLSGIMQVLARLLRPDNLSVGVGLLRLGSAAHADRLASEHQQHRR